jgi:redox-sensitive bicupin YhaK (pirin superfamily)
MQDQPTLHLRPNLEVWAHILIGDLRQLPLHIVEKYHIKTPNISILASEPSSALLLAGLPLEEPIVGYGPFVMNTETEIANAIRDFNSGMFGVM